MAEFTDILRSVENGEQLASKELFSLVYDELRKLAAARLAHESPGQTLQPTALVHEAYLRLVGDGQCAEWESRRHFFAAAAEAMRRILVERARRRAAVKHGGMFTRTDLDEQVFVEEQRSTELIALDEALAELETHDREAAQIVMLRYFAGLCHQDAAAAMNISRRTADRLWLVAKAWLYKHLATK